ASSSGCACTWSKHSGSLIAHIQPCDTVSFAWRSFFARAARSARAPDGRSASVATETARAVGEIRRYYEGTKVPVVPTARAREDVLQLLDERKTLQRAGEALLTP